MIQKMYSVRDIKAQAFLQPFFSSANGSALRALSDAVADTKSPIGLHPEDYQMFEIGSFDDQSGEVVALRPIRMLAVASDFSLPVTPISKQLITNEMMEYAKVPEDLKNGKK